MTGTVMDDIPRVAFGLGGVIYLAGSPRDNRLEKDFAAGFLQGPRTSIRELRADDMYVVTAQHVEDARTPAGCTRDVLPQAGELHGVVYGQFFETQLTPDERSRYILGRFAAHGPASFRELNGGWIALVWNRTTQEASFVRQGFGVQTLYVRQQPGRLLFATDLRVFDLVGVPGELDEQSAAEFLHYLYVPSPRTIVSGCTSVLPGHVLTIGQTARQDRFSAPRFVRGASIAGVRDIDRELEAKLPEFEDRLLTAVADCVPSHGRVAIGVSGGKDSSTLAVALSKICPERVLAFNVGAVDARYDETQDAAVVCRTLNLPLQSYVPSDDDLARGLYQFARVQDQPVGDPAALPYYLAIASLPDDCAVVIDGTGNDYYFGYPSVQKGVHRYKRRLQVQRFIPDAIWPMLLAVAAHGSAGFRDLSHFWSRPVEETFVAWEGWSAQDLTALLGRDVTFEETYLWKLMREADPENWLELLTDVVCLVWEPHAAYRKAVHFAQAAGRTIRFPFMDDRLAEFVNALPLELKVRDGVNKQILRAYMAKHLPVEILRKPKGPFVFDLNRLLNNPAHAWVEQLQAAGLLRIFSNWSEEPVRALLRRYREASHDERWQHRLYALALLATVTGVKSGNHPDLQRPA